MYRITNECIEKEINSLLENGSFCRGNIEWFNALCDAMRNLSKMHHKFTDEDAKDWMANLKPAPRWTMDQTSAVMAQKGFYHNPYEFWVAMNVLFSDYGRTMAKYNADKPEVWADLAHDFLEDEDAAAGKIGRYYRDIVKR